jgi:Fe-S cluster biogenesis protein NfuA
VSEREAADATDRVAVLLQEIGIAPTVERAQAKSEELVRALVAFYGDGLERVLDVVHEASGDRSPAIFAALCEDRYVENLLALHDLHPRSLEDRVQAALDGIRPYLESHEGNVELLRVADGVAYVRLGGSCDGCQSSAATLKNAVETAILERVTEITAVIAEGVAVRPNSLTSRADRLRGHRGALGAPCRAAVCVSRRMPRLYAAIRARDARMAVRALRGVRSPLRRRACRTRRTERTPPRGTAPVDA